MCRLRHPGDEPALLGRAQGEAARLPLQPRPPALRAAAARLHRHQVVLEGLRRQDAHRQARQNRRRSQQRRTRKYNSFFSAANRLSDRQSTTFSNSQHSDLSARDSVLRDAPRLL